MKKNDRISAYVATLDVPPGLDLDPHYTGFFACFNRGEYYEAHDVLEHLWLRTPGANHAFFKGLIQIAGAFVHLQKHHLRPDHPKDGQRLHPAARLFALGMKNLAPFAPLHLRLDVAALHALCTRHASALSESEFTRNPWHPSRLPRVELR